MCGLLLTKMSLETLAFYLAARAHYNGAIVQAQEQEPHFPNLFVFFLPKGAFLEKSEEFG